MGLRDVRLWCHTTALVSGSSVKLFVYNMRPCHQSVTLSVENLPAITNNVMCLAILE